VALMAGPALAQGRQKGGQGKGGQGRGRGMGGFSTLLIANASVQEEIKATDEQKEKARELVTKQGEKMRDLFQGGGFDREKMQQMQTENAKEGDKLAKEILKPDQLKRYNQIKWQNEGVLAFQDSEVVTALKLTGEQKDKLKALGEDFTKDDRELLMSGRGGGGNFQEIAQKRTALKKDFMAKADKVLTDSQQKEWKELTGKPFEVRQEFGGRRGRGQDKDK
jgi:Spy/CpxP family protein refolding chaperone